MELVIFDCDGVLIDSEILAIQADIACLAEHGIPISPEEIMARYIGVNATAMFADLETRFRRPLPPGFGEMLRQRIAASFEAQLQAMPGVFSLLGALNYRACVASSSAPERLRHSLSLVGLYDRFAPHIFSVTQVPSGKPAPDLFLFAAEQMGSPPSHCVVIEDSIAGVQAAKAAGMVAFGFYGGSHCGIEHRKGLLNAGADAVFPDMAKLATSLSHLPQTHPDSNVR